MKSYVLFGAGQVGRSTLKQLEKGRVAFFVDNDPAKAGGEIGGVPIYWFPDKKEDLKQASVVLSVTEPYQKEIRAQLEEAGISDVKTLPELRTGITREKILQRPDYIAIYQKAISWIQSNTMEGRAIICYTDKPLGYPEVTGYYIPTLLRWGYRDLAVSFAKWLCGIQKPDGSWYDTDNEVPYVFDTAQILKGLLAVREILPEVDSHIEKGCDWVLSNMQENGRLTTPATEAWGSPRVCSELIHLYCLSPLVQAAKVFRRPAYGEAARRILSYYKEQHYDEIMDFGLLSHFYAYVMEGLLDMGEEAMVREAMGKVAALQSESGAVPAYQDVNWVCSTGLFQFALVWFRLGETERGNRVFTYACKLQNESGGWYGSYLLENNPNEINDYFPDSEISWAVKYFLDALYYKNYCEFDQQADSFLESIDQEDGRYQIIRQTIAAESAWGGGNRLQIVDVGCGKGRYLKNLLKDEPENHYYGVDLSENVLAYIEDERVIIKQGSLTCIDYPDQYFDVVYTCEALEHAVDTESAVRELARVTKPGGKIVIIDKNQAELGRLEIGEWEVWFDAEKLKALLSGFCEDVQVIRDVAYENKEASDGLFLAWIGTVHS